MPKKIACFSHIEQKIPQFTGILFKIRPKKLGLISFTICFATRAEKNLCRAAVWPCLVSISPFHQILTFYTWLFRTKVSPGAFVYLDLRFVRLWCKYIVAKAAGKMLVKLTTVVYR